MRITVTGDNRIGNEAYIGIGSLGILRACRCVNVKYYSVTRPPWAEMSGPQITQPQGLM